MFSDKYFELDSNNRPVTFNLAQEDLIDTVTVTPCRFCGVPVVIDLAIEHQTFHESVVSRKPAIRRTPRKDKS